MPALPSIETRIVLDRGAIEAPNLAGRFSEGELKEIGQWVWEGFDRDKASRMVWEKRSEAGMDLALQAQKAKNFPWPGCSNIAFPLVTIAGLQFHAQAYPVLVQPPDPVHMRVVGDDPDGQEHARADRIAEHMSWQVLEEDESWEEQHDACLLNIAFVGCGFKKLFYDPERGHNASEYVPAKHFYVDYWAKSLEKAQRKTHRIPLYRNDIVTRVRQKVFRDVLEDEWYTQVPTNAQAGLPEIRTDKRQGVVPSLPDHATPFWFLEQHAYLDLDGDGYAEPWIFTVEEQSRNVCRIVSPIESPDDIHRGADGVESISLRPTFIKYSFIPAADGGFYDTGFGVLLGPLNESVNSILNQLVDSGTMAVTGGGFLGRGAKIRGGVYTFAPLEWKRVDSTGDDLRKNIFPLPVRAPDPVLFQLLGLLIQYSNRVSATMEAMVGESTGQNTPAETSRTMVAQGMKVYAAIFKRLWRSMKAEFKVLYRLNGLYMRERVFFGEGKSALSEDYRGSARGLVPSADPNVTSEGEMMAKLMVAKQSSQVTPGYDVPYLERRILRALKFDAIDQLYPGPDKVPPLPNPKSQAEEAKTKREVIKKQFDREEFVVELLEKIRLNNAQIAKLMADAAKTIEEAKAVGGGHEIESIRVAIEAIVAQNEVLQGQVQSMTQKKGEGDDEGGMGRLAGPSGNTKANGMAPGGAGSPQGSVGGGGVH